MSVPVNVITGALGAGKTTAIARLLGAKPANEPWVVILNEFTDAGVDALTLAMAARGAYDVRAIPGGCLCCTGEEDFQRQLRALLRGPQPARILIEPSGLGHPGAVIEELREHERAGALKLKSTIALIDAPRLSVFDADHSVEKDQLEAADVLLLSKAETAGESERRRFQAAGEKMFPAKRWIGFCEQGALPAPALEPPAAPYAFELPSRPPQHLAELGRAAGAAVHEHSGETRQREFRRGAHSIGARTQSLLGRMACGWSVPAEIIFHRQPLLAALADIHHPLFDGVERFKAVLRTGMEQRLLVQRHAGEFSCSESAWRQDSRIEVQMQPGAKANWTRWDDFWTGLMES